MSKLTYSNLNDYIFLNLKNYINSFGNNEAIKKYLCEIYEVSLK